MTKRAEEAKADYLAGLSYKEIAERYNVSQSTVRNWKSRNHWDEDKLIIPSATKNATLSEKVAAKRDKSETKRNFVTENKNDELTDKQKLFCAYYMQRFNATWAYHKVYGSSWETARTQGSVFLTKPNIKQELDRLKRLNEEQLHATQFDITRKLLQMAFADLGDYVHFGSESAFDDEGNEYQRSYVYFNEQSEVDTSQIKEVHIGQNGPEIKLHDQLKALELLYKMLPEPSGHSLETDSMIAAIKDGFDQLKGSQKTNGIAEKQG
ncbi:terminase [Secundilactobacillus kimchicus]|uniref:terminase small subunit n=1 Tax=Secundilactobacillus kimchicus TaxID=528209 RepID=UPI001C02ADBA|nr:terminase [Secundilactobacillus kimchicus]